MAPEHRGGRWFESTAAHHHAIERGCVHTIDPRGAGRAMVCTQRLIRMPNLDRCSHQPTNW